MDGTKADGLSITELPPDNFLYAAGLREGDVVQTVNGALITDEASALEVLRSAAKGFSIQLGTVRGGKSRKLFYALVNEEATDRVRVVWALASKGEAAVPDLIEALKDKEAKVRSGAAQALCRIGPQAKAAIPVLLACLKDPDRWVRIQVGKALGSMGETVVPKLVEVLKGEDQDSRFAAADALGEVGEAAVPALVDALKQDELRYLALEALTKLGPRAKGAIPALIDLLKRHERPAVGRCLAHIGDPAAPALKEFLKSGDPNLRWEAAVILVEIGVGRDSMLFRDLTPPARAGQEVTYQGKTASEWTLLLHDTEPSVRSYAAEALGKMGSVPADSADELGFAVLDTEKAVQLSAAGALANIGARARRALPFLVRALRSRDLEVVRGAAHAIANLGPEAQPAIPALIEILKHDFERPYDLVGLGRFQDRRCAAYTLSKIGAAALPSLLELLRSDEEELRSWAAKSLTWMGKSVESELVRALEDEDASLRRGAAEALRCMEELRSGQRSDYFDKPW
jgi:HEAT repeat protein